MMIRIKAISILTIALLCTVGCRSASQLAWWKSGDRAENTALANSAPELPSDAAKHVEIASAGGISTTGGQAAPFVPDLNAVASTTTTTQPTPAASSGTPTTGVPPYSAENALAAVASAQNTGSARIATNAPNNVAQPYDPAAVPAAPMNPTNATLAVSADSGQRYGAPAAGLASTYGQTGLSAGASTPTFSGTQAASATAAAVSPTSPPATANRYAGVASESQSVAQYAQAQTNVVAASATGGLPPEIASSVASGADRYGSSPTDSAPTPSNAALESTVSPLSATYPSVAANTAATYRPGGTSSFPTNDLRSGSVAVASRPESGAPSGERDTTPNVYSPNSSSISEPASRYR